MCGLLQCRTISAKTFCTHLLFVPKYNPVHDEDIERLNNFINFSKKLLILTGAGISTESGIPDYRSQGVGLYARSSNRPVQYQDFVKKEHIRKRYWARNYVGWPRFSSFRPNSTHTMVRDLEVTYGRVSCVVTQNVDRLHNKAGSQNVIELHGTAFNVMCLGCDNKIDRQHLQSLLEERNPHIKATSTMIRPDGDVDISQDDVRGFQVPSCSQCGGILKPDIVFFGDNVPQQRVEAVKREVEHCDALLVLGSSLTVFSSYRIILQASELKRKIAIVNIGPTRGDKHAHIKIDTKCGDIVSRLRLH
ncbi:NAD-dependent protein deacylase Sirt4 [Periplaneta americana]|uniref:NAD-dependent protein deacylase Sirt4 n=1 Tax=Periplaneta americana TaxID=6978 RepID=UPI0037E96A77